MCFVSVCIVRISIICIFEWFPLGSLMYIIRLASVDHVTTNRDRSLLLCTHVVNANISYYAKLHQPHIRRQHSVAVHATMHVQSDNHRVQIVHTLVSNPEIQMVPNRRKWSTVFLVVISDPRPFICRSTYVIVLSRSQGKAIKLSDWFEFTMQKQEHVRNSSNNVYHTAANISLDISLFSAFPSKPFAYRHIMVPIRLPLL